MTSGSCTALSLRWHDPDQVLRSRPRGHLSAPVRDSRSIQRSLREPAHRSLHAGQRFLQLLRADEVVARAALARAAGRARGRRSRSSLAVVSSISSLPARASSSAREDTSSSGTRPPSTRWVRTERWSSASKCSGGSSASRGTSSGSAMQPASASRSSRVAGVEHLLREPRVRGACRGGARRQLHGHVELVVRVAPRVLPVGRLGCTLEHVPHTHERLLSVGLRARSPAARGRRGSALRRRAAPRSRLQGQPDRARWQRHDLDHEALRGRQLHAAKRRCLARRVAVEAEEELACEPRELHEVALGECRAHRRDDRLEPLLTKRQHVGFPSTTTALSCFVIAARARSSP